MVRVAPILVFLAAAFVAVAFLPSVHATASPGPETSSTFYRSKDSVTGGLAYSFNEISGAGGVAVPFGCANVDDCYSGALTVPFTFNFFGAAVPSIYVNTNGFLSTGTGATAAQQYTPTDLPTSSAPNGIIAGYWVDLVPACGGSVLYKTSGTAPNREFIVEYKGVYLNAQKTTGTCQGLITFQIRLQETSNDIYVALASVFSEGASSPTTQKATVGIEDGTGANGLRYIFREMNPSPATADTLTNTAVLFYPDTAPVAADSTLDTWEDTAGTLSLTATDADGDLYSCQGVGLPPEASIAGCVLTYTPAPDKCDYGTATPVKVKWHPVDTPGKAGADVSVTVNVACVNDQPKFAIGASIDPTTVGDTGAPVTVFGVATGLDPGNAMPDEMGQQMHFIVTTSKDSAFAQLPTVDPSTNKPQAAWTTASAGSITFTPLASACSDTQKILITIKLQDTGGTVHGGIDMSAPKTFNLILSCNGQAAPPPPPPPAAAQVTDGDADGDGFTDEFERMSNSDPYNPASTPYDHDADGIVDDNDNCPSAFNPDQADSNGDGRGDVCQGINNSACAQTTGHDSDGDKFPDACDNCPGTPNPDQSDVDKDRVGDVCDVDADGDGAANADEVAQHSDPLNKASVASDRDGDGVVDTQDNCAPAASAADAAALHVSYNPDQADGNHNGRGDICDPLAPLELDASATYDGQTVHVSWTAKGDAEIRTQASVLVGGNGVASDSPRFGPGSRTADLGVPGLTTVQWRVVLDDPYNASTYIVRTGNATAPPPPAPIQPQAVKVPSELVAGTSYGVAYRLPATATSATLRLQSGDGRTVATVPLKASSGGTWSGTGTAPAPGKYEAVVAYSDAGTRQAFDSGAWTVKAPAPVAPPASVDPTAATAGSGASLQGVFWSVGILGALAVLGLVALAVLGVQRRRATAQQERQAAWDQQIAGEQAATAEAPGYDDPIDV